MTAGELNKMVISNMPDREFKVMVMKLLTGPEKIMEDLNEILNKETENNLKFLNMYLFLRGRGAGGRQRERGRHRI